MAETQAPSTGAQIGSLIGGGLIGALAGSGGSGPPQYGGQPRVDPTTQGIQDQQNTKANLDPNDPVGKALGQAITLAGGKSPYGTPLGDNANTQAQTFMEGAQGSGQALMGNQQDQGDSSRGLGGNQDQGMQDALNQRAQRTYNSSVGSLQAESNMKGVQARADAQAQAYQWAAQKSKLYNDAMNAKAKADQDQKQAEGSVLGSVLGVLGGAVGLLAGPAGSAAGSAAGQALGKAIG